MEPKRFFENSGDYVLVFNHYAMNVNPVASIKDFDILINQDYGNCYFE